MMLQDKRKAIDTIMARRMAAGGEATSAPMKMDMIKDEDGMFDGRHAAAQDVIAAMHEKSPMKMVAALANFIDMHKSKMEEANEGEAL